MCMPFVAPPPYFRLGFTGHDHVSVMSGWAPTPLMVMEGGTEAISFRAAHWQQLASSSHTHRFISVHSLLEVI